MGIEWGTISGKKANYLPEKDAAIKLKYSTDMT